MKLFNLFIVLFSMFKGSEPEIEDKKEDEQDLDLNTLLDKNLEGLQKSLAAKGADENVSELLKSKEGKKKLKEYLKDAEDDDENEDDEDNEDEMKKSFDDSVESFEDVIDANQILKSFVNTLSKLVTSVSKLEKSVSSVAKDNQKNSEVIKSIAAVTVSSTELLKSTSKTIEAFGGIPKAIPGKIEQVKVERLLKSEDGNDLTFAQVRQGLLKGFHEGKISSSEVSKWEMSRFNTKVLSNDTVALVKSFAIGSN